MLRDNSSLITKLLLLNSNSITPLLRLSTPPLPRPRHRIPPLTYSPAPHPGAEWIPLAFAFGSAPAQFYVSSAELLPLSNVESAARPSQYAGVRGGGAAVPPAGAGGRCERMRESEGTRMWRWGVGEEDPWL